MATYEVKLTFKTLSNPREVVELITSKVKESIPVLTIHGEFHQCLNSTNLQLMYVLS